MLLMLHHQGLHVHGAYSDQSLPTLEAFRVHSVEPSGHILISFKLATEIMVLSLPLQEQPHLQGNQRPNSIRQSSVDASPAEEELTQSVHRMGALWHRFDCQDDEAAPA